MSRSVLCAQFLPLRPKSTQQTWESQEVASFLQEKSWRLKAWLHKYAQNNFRNLETLERSYTEAGSVGDGESTRPSSGASSKSQLAQVPQATQAAQTQPSIPLPPRSSVGNVNCPEGIPAASTALRAAAMPNRDPTLAPSKSSASSKPSKIAESPPPHLRPPSTSPTSPTSPSSASPSRPRNSPMVSVRVTRRAEVDSRSPQSQPSQPSQTSHLPNIPGNPGVSKAPQRTSIPCRVCW